ncbi:hypothetical protein Q31b_42800 [Novipirellula aureliae]|uniref:Uncharacterized protein n=1 Tax=Novipirellula aureliae TaxID=2527966 RepID=A0A5C6DLK9_9BACT|nr:hypothetical protein [Novipirellula aureliae]TWU37492.1 hypothetical protein Q31b_42800 [Novipirellula aureliae]
MPIREHADWTEAIATAVKAARNDEHNKKQKNYDSHVIINFLNMHYNTILNEIIYDYRRTGDGRKHADPVREATNQIGRYIKRHLGQVRIGVRTSFRRIDLSDGSNRNGECECSIWEI